MKIHGPFTSWVTWVKWPLVTLRCDFRNSKHSSRSYEAICKLMPLMTLAAALNRTSERPLGGPQDWEPKIPISSLAGVQSSIQ